MSLWQRVRARLATPPQLPAAPADPERAAWMRSRRLQLDGLNVVGYHRRQLGLGDAGRVITSALIDGHVPNAPLAFAASPSPAIEPPFAMSPTIDHATTLAVVSADQMPVLHEWHPEIFEHSDRMIGYCFWELSQLSEAGRSGVKLLDEVWAPTTFVQQVFESLDVVPVHHVPLPIPRPEPSRRERSSFAPLADVGDRLIFGVAFDYFSVLERKNPIAAIEAFTRAFAPGEGPVLVVKTLNAIHHPDDDARLRAAAGDRADIRIWDEHLDDGDQFAFLGHLDVLVSLHRGEGLGKHLAEAMWLGVPCIATGYSGNLDFMTNECARLIEYTLIDVEGGGSIYPAGTQWADPDIGHAATAMRELADDTKARIALGAAAHRQMTQQPDGADFAATARRLLGT